jgi:hypothetical protein
VRGYLHASRRRRLRGVLAAALVAVAIAVPSAWGSYPVIFGNTFTISGAVPSGKPGETVQILARAYGQQKFASAGTITTTANGNWTFTSRPRITTTYLAVWRGTRTPSITGDVTPRLDLALSKGMLTVTATAANPLRGHSLVVQLRQKGTQWHNVRIVVLGPASRAKVPFTAPRGRSEIRLYISKSQAGAGYIAGFSGVLVYRNAA